MIPINDGPSRDHNPQKWGTQKQKNNKKNKTKNPKTHTKTPKTHKNHKNPQKQKKKIIIETTRRRATNITTRTIITQEWTFSPVSWIEKDVVLVDGP